TCSSLDAATGACSCARRRVHMWVSARMLEGPAAIHDTTSSVVHTTELTAGCSPKLDWKNTRVRAATPPAASAPAAAHFPRSRTCTRNAHKRTAFIAIALAPAVNRSGNRFGNPKSMNSRITISNWIVAPNAKTMSNAVLDSSSTRRFDDEEAAPVRSVVVMKSFAALARHLVWKYTTSIGTAP